MTVGVVPDRARLHGRNGNLGAREEARLLAGLRNEIGLGEGLDQALVLQRRNQRIDLKPVRVDRPAPAATRTGAPAAGKTPLTTWHATVSCRRPECQLVVPWPGVGRLPVVER